MNISRVVIKHAFMYCFVQLYADNALFSQLLRWWMHAPLKMVSTAGHRI